VTTGSVAEQRCLRHPMREAVARCPQCHYFYCRECITEHEDRVLCADCLAKLLRPSEKRGSVFGQMVIALLSAVGIATAWLFFYSIGELLARAPISFHEGTVWEKLLPEK
jgi:hypothetical protein